MRKALVLWLLTVPLVSFAQANAPGPVPDPTVHRHLGFFLHLDIGVGYLSSSPSPSQPSGASSLSGAALPLSIVIGGAVAEDWILAGDLWGVSGPAPSGTSWGTTAFGGAGLNVTHYFMPANVYLSLTPSFTGLVFDGGQPFVDRAASGFGVKLALGKEWWVGDHWGLGVAVQGYFASNEGHGTATGTKWTTWGGGFVFSATYN